MDVPPDLYSRFLGERVKLPILNRKPGQSRVTKTKPGKRITDSKAKPLPNEITENAFRRGAGQAFAEGTDPFDDVNDTIEEGFAYMQPRDWVVKNQTIAKKPDTKAVVVFVLDASASTAQYMESFKRFV